MKIAVMGAGAIGGYVGAALAAAGAEVTFVARGRHLAAIRQRGNSVPVGGDSQSRKDGRRLTCPTALPFANPMSRGPMPSSGLILPSSTKYKPL